MDVSRLFAFGFLLLGIVCAQDTGTLASIARRAQLAGKTEAVVSAPTMLLASPESLKDSLTHTSLVLAQPLATAYSHDDYMIHTWHKYRVLESLSFQDQLFQENFKDAIPPSLLPLERNEFVTAENGGIMTIGGVRITMRDPTVTALPQQTRHLLFLLFTSSREVAVLNYGPSASFYVDDAGVIHPHVNQPRGPLAKEMESATAGKLTALRDFLSATR